MSINIHHAVSSMAKYDREQRQRFTDAENATAVIGKLESKGVRVMTDRLQGLHSALAKMFCDRRSGGGVNEAIKMRCDADDDIHGQCTVDRAFGELLVGAFIDGGIIFEGGEPWWRKPSDEGSQEDRES